jgi:DNA-binding phage protein
MNATRDKSYDETLTAALTDPDEAAAYLDAVMDLEDPAVLEAALCAVGKTLSMEAVGRV